MARTETLTNLITRVRQRADMVGSNFCGDTEITGYINESIAELYDLLVGKYGEDYFEKTTPHTFSTAAGTGDYNLPSDFFKLTRIAVLDGSRYRNLERFMHRETSYSRAVNRVWACKLYYVPCATKLTSGSDTFDGINGWEEYPVVDAAMKCLIKEESDISAVMAEKAQLRDRINRIAPNRDKGQPHRVQDVSSYGRNRDARFLYLDNDIVYPRYRLKSTTIELLELDE